MLSLWCNVFLLRGELVFLMHSACVAGSRADSKHICDFLT